NRLDQKQLPIPELKKRLFDRVDVAFAKSEKLFYWALNPDERETLGKMECSKIENEKTRNLCAFPNGSWGEFTAQAKAWRPNSECVLPDNLLFNTGVSALNELNLDSALDLGHPSDSRGYDGDQGQILIVVADPIADLDKGYQICVADNCDGSPGTSHTVASP